MLGEGPQAGGHLPSVVQQPRVRRAPCDEPDVPEGAAAALLPRQEQRDTSHPVSPPSLPSSVRYSEQGDR